jgi:hypothetical protein
MKILTQNQLDERSRKAYELLNKEIEDINKKYQKETDKAYAKYCKNK